MGRQLKNSQEGLSRQTTKLFNHYKFSIQAKITLPYLILSFIIALGGALFITELIMQAFDKRFDNSLVETGKVASDMMVIEENLMLETLRLITNTADIDIAIQDGNAEKIREIAMPIAYNSFEDVVVVLDDTSENLLTLENVSRTEMIDYAATRGNPYFASLPFVEPVLSATIDDFGDKYAGVAPLNDELIFFISGPVKDDNENLVGVVMVGKNVNNILNSIRRETLAQISFYDFEGALITSTLQSQQDLDTANANHIIENQNQQSYIRDVLNSDINYREVISPWEARERFDLGLIGVSFSTDFMLETNQATRWQVFVLVAVLLFLTGVTGIFIARMITKPITRLKEAAEAVSKGDLDVSVNPETQDEVALLANSFNSMIGTLRSSREELLDAYDKTLEGWTKALELKDRETEGHTKRVTEMTVELARRMGFKEDSLDHLRRGALLHDIGKVGIPDSILKKPGKLTDDEFEIIKNHPQYAYEMLSQISFLRPAIDIPHCHHERWDGTGYPRGLKGDDIPFSSRIFAVVDVWDAVTSDRIYRNAMSTSVALEIIKRENGSHFDPAVVEEFLKLLHDEAII